MPCLTESCRRSPPATNRHARDVGPTSDGPSPTSAAGSTTTSSLTPG